MEPTQTSFIPLLVVVGLAFLVPLILARIRAAFFPVVVGEILAGVAVGRSGLGLVEEDAVLRILSELGFVFLMFLSGLEIHLPAGVSGSKPSRTEERGGSRLGNPFLLGHALFALSLAGSAAAAFYLKGTGAIRDPWLMALILSTTSLGVVVPVLKQRGLTAGAFGQTVLAGALVADFLSILLISVYVLLRGEGPSAEILLVLVLLSVKLANPRYLGRAASEIDMGRNTLVLAIRREGASLVPDATTRFRANERSR